jgi:hypothetical protein
VLGALLLPIILGHVSLNSLPLKAPIGPQVQNLLSFRPLQDHNLDSPGESGLLALGVIVAVQAPFKGYSS